MSFGDRRLLTSDPINLKAKVKAEMLRRKYSGSVEAYGGTAWDFTVEPENLGPVLGEHLEKNLVPMQQVNPAGLPVYPGPLTQQGQEAMETKITAWAARSLTDNSGSDCQNGCTGACYGGCASGCSGCSGSCVGTCTGTCSVVCGWSCTGTCTGCTGCSGTCTGTYTGDCGAACIDTCRARCTATDSGCFGCGGGVG